MPQATSPLERLQAAGWGFIPIQRGAKRPIPGRGVDSVQCDLVGIDASWYGAVPPPGFVVIDFDLKHDASGALRDGWAEFCAAHDEPPQGWVVRTPSGGRHVYLRVPVELGVVRNSPIIVDAVDVRGQRGYVLGPGSHAIVDGVERCYELLDEDVAEIPEAPDWLLGLLNFERAPVHRVGPGTQVPSHGPALSGALRPDPEFVADEEWRDLFEALRVVPSDEYHMWVRVGHALAMAAPLGRARELWVLWSAKSPKFDSRVVERKWRELEATANGSLSHRTVYWLGMQFGWANASGRPVHDPGVPINRPGPSSSSGASSGASQHGAKKPSEPDLGLAEALVSSAPQSSPFPWDDILPVLDGPLLDAVEWIEACNPRSLRLAALAAALSGMGSALARRVYVQWAPGSSARPLPLQQPLIVVARSGAGKDAPLRCAARMTAVAGYTSLPALPFHPNTLYAELVRSRGAIALHLDEVDGTLASLHSRSEHAAAKEAAIKTMLSSGEHLPAPIVSTTNPQRLAVEGELGVGAWVGGVSRPALALFGVATRQVWDRLASNVSGGLVGRMLVLDADAPLTPFRAPAGNSTDLPSTTQAWIERLNPPLSGPDDPRLLSDAPLAVLEPDASALAARDVIGAVLTQRANQAVDAGKEHYADLAARAIEPVLRLAGSFATMGVDDPLAGVVSERHVYAAAAAVLWCIERTAGETSQREDLSGVGRAIRVIRDRLARDHRSRNGAGSPWHYRVRVTRGIEAHADLALRALESSGEVSVDGKRLALTARVLGG